MAYSSTRALELLRIGTNNSMASFRDGQEEAISQIVTSPARLLVVQKTGWGKSFVYFIAAKLLREAGSGPALLVSPLLALMRNQIAAAKRMGVRAATINSDNRDDWTTVEAAISRNEMTFYSYHLSDWPMTTSVHRCWLILQGKFHYLLLTRLIAYLIGDMTFVHTTDYWSVLYERFRPTSAYWLQRLPLIIV